MQKQIFFSFVLVMMLLGKVKAQHKNWKKSMPPP